MKIQSTEVKTTTKDVELDLKGVYKEPFLLFTLDGIEILKVAIDASTVPPISGVNDTLLFQVSLSGNDGVAQTLTKQIHIPTFKAESGPVNESGNASTASTESKPN